MEETSMAVFIKIPGGKVKKFRGRFPGHDTCSKAKYANLDDRRFFRFGLRNQPSSDSDQFEEYVILDEGHPTPEVFSCGLPTEWEDSNQDHFIAI